jgi:hypothetical protein
VLIILSSAVAVAAADGLVAAVVAALSSTKKINQYQRVRMLLQSEQVE